MRIDRTGITYEHLVALHDTGKRDKHGNRIWAARCTVIRDGMECGRVIETYRLGRSAAPKSCGYHTAHFRRMSHNSAYNSWRAMIWRCDNPKHLGYPKYGARGITVCERWRDFRNFLEDMGLRPEGTTLGRVIDRGNYEPGNVFWMTQAEQNLARKNNHALRKWELSRASIRKPPVSAGFEEIAVA
jgi:hypothetical protein